MNGFTRVFLILLRLAIGWHFLFEGIEKIQSVQLGPTETNRPWTSRGYLRGAVGPLADYFRRQTGDSDEEALALLEVKPIPAGEDPARVPPRQRISPLLDQAWSEYFERFAAHYDLPAEQRQRAQAKLDQSKDQAVQWMLSDEHLREVERSFSSATVKIKESPRQRIEAYRANVAQIRDIEERKLPAFNNDVEGQKLRALRAETNRQRTELMADLQKPLVEALQALLTPEQKEKGPVPIYEQDERRSWYQKTRVEWIDWLTMYGLTAVGIGLLLGILTRTACLGGVLFLAMFYLTQPPFPWVPTNPLAEGHYLFVNKNLIEMLALLVLATLPTGRWLGLDGLLQFLSPWRRRRLAAERREEQRLGLASR
jgi:uncharacterized membrane protein YphA (DoxX/SURF4 family)